MQQLVQLQKNADKFKALDAELIFIFREEREGVAGLQKIRKNTKTTFTLALDLNKKSTSAYSAAKGAFQNFVVDKKGVIRAALPGTKSTRSTADQLLAELKKLEGS